MVEAVMKKISGWILVCLILLAVSVAAASGTGIDRLPLELGIPATVPAGLDAAIHWAPEVSGQLLEVYFVSNGNEFCLGGFSAECDIPVPGHLIAALSGGCRKPESAGRSVCDHRDSPRGAADLSRL